MTNALAYFCRRKFKEKTSFYDINARSTQGPQFHAPTVTTVSDFDLPRPNPGGDSTFPTSTELQLSQWPSPTITLPTTEATTLDYAPPIPAYDQVSML